MSAANTINGITLQTANYAGAVVAGVQAAQAARAANPEVTGRDAQGAVVSSVLDGIDVGSGALETSTNPTVASVAVLVNLVVNIFKLLRHPAFVPAPASVAAAAQ
jgi:ethanolamine ammonia-lyase large subunit